MSQKLNSRTTDADIQAVLDRLRPFQDAHPRAQIEAYRLNSVTIRVRIIGPEFKGKDRVQCDEEVRALLNQLPDDVFGQITLLLLLTPVETKRSWSNVEFDNPAPSNL